MNVVFTQVSETMDTILIKEAFTVPRIREEKANHVTKKIVRLHSTQMFMHGDLDKTLAYML